MIGMVKLKILDTDAKFRLRGKTLRLAIEVCPASKICPKNSACAFICTFSVP